MDNKKKGVAYGGGKLTIKRVMPLIDEYHGNLSAISRKLAVSRSTLYKLIDRYPALGEALNEAREKMVDNVESTLYSKALDGDTACMIFFLKTQGKTRGYVERSEVTGADGGAIEVDDVRKSIQGKLSRLADLGD